MSAYFINDIQAPPPRGKTPRFRNRRLARLPPLNSNGKLTV
jgi:hypothetical protein